MLIKIGVVIFLCYDVAKIIISIETKSVFLTIKTSMYFDNIFFCSPDLKAVLM